MLEIQHGEISVPFQDIGDKSRTCEMKDLTLYLRLIIYVLLSKSLLHYFRCRILQIFPICKCMFKIQNVDIKCFRYNTFSI